MKGLVIGMRTYFCGHEPCQKLLLLKGDSDTECRDHSSSKFVPGLGTAGLGLTQVQDCKVGFLRRLQHRITHNGAMN